MKTLARPDDLAEVLRRLHSVRPGHPARWGRMSAHQMICHLADAMYVASGERAATPASGLFQRTVVKWIALYAPLRWPPGIPTPVEVDQEIGGTRPQDFTADVARVESLLRRFADEPDATRVDHPVFGRMSRNDWLRWGYLHADHHLRQFGV